MSLLAVHSFGRSLLEVILINTLDDKNGNLLMTYDHIPHRILAGWTPTKGSPADKHQQGPVVVVSVPATQAVPMPALNVVLVLSPQGDLAVYSGALKVILFILYMYNVYSHVLILNIIY